MVVTQLFDLNARIQQLTWSLIFYEKYSTSLSTIVLVVLTTANFGGFSNFCRYYTRSQAGKSTGYRPTLKPLGTCCAFILNLVNKKGLPVWKLAYSFSVYIILPENTHQYLFTAADNSPWNIFHSRFAIFRRHFWKLELKLRKCR